MRELGEGGFSAFAFFLACQMRMIIIIRMILIRI